MFLELQQIALVCITMDRPSAFLYLTVSKQTQYPVVFFRLLIQYTEDKSIYQWRGYFYACLIFLAAVVQSVIQHQHYHITTTVGMQLRTALIGAVYRKVCLSTHHL